MADPRIKPTMDTLDYLSVISYRLGLSAAAPLVALLPWVNTALCLKLLFIATVLCASTLHLYLKSVRLLLQMATWVGLLCWIFGLPLLGLGGCFITLGGLCVKEQFCFKLPGLQFQPLILASLWLCLYWQQTVAAQVLAAMAALLLLMCTIAKWRMPLHFDIGDKSKYQI